MTRNTEWNRSLFYCGGILAAVMMAPHLAWSADPPVSYDGKCKVCHSIAGDGGPMASEGGALDGVGTKRDEAWLRAYLADPKSKIAESKMPKMPLTSEELDQLIAFLLGLT